MRIAIEYIRWLQQERLRINKPSIQDIEFYENGMVVKIDQACVDEFEFTGLNNTDFIVTDFYKQTTFED